MRQVLLLGCVLCAAAVAQGAEQTVLGRTLIIKSSGIPTILLKAKESASDDTLVGNPVSGGATLTITANGATPSAQTYALPAGTSVGSQKPFWTGNALKGFKYADPRGENGPVKRAQVKLRAGVFQVKAKIDGALAAVSVLPPNPGSDGCALLTIGGGDSYSMQFASGDVTNDGPQLFKVTRPDGEGSCVTTTTTSTSSTTTTSTVPLPLIPPPGDAPLRYRDAVFGTVTKTSDIVFGSAVDASNNTITLRLDFSQPIGDTVTARPLIVWVHGGSFTTGDKTSGELLDEMDVFSKKGYVNASINYRLEPGGCTGSVPVTTCITAMREALEDAQTAVRFLRTNAGTYGIDTSRIAIGGSSAGAITALHVAFTNEDPTAAVRAAVSLSGANLIATISPDDAPTLDFHGTADGLVAYSWAVTTVNQALAAGLDSFLTTWVGAGHVPYVQHRTEILDQTTNFLWWEMDMANAAQ